MIKLYTDSAGKDLFEKYNESFGAWTTDNRHKHEGVKGESYYIFVVSEEDVEKFVWSYNENLDFYEYDYVVNKDGDAEIDFVLIEE